MFDGKRLNALSTLLAPTGEWRVDDTGCCCLPIFGRDWLIATKIRREDVKVVKFDYDVDRPNIKA